METACSRVRDEAPTEVTEGEVICGSHVTIVGPD